MSKQVSKSHFKPRALHYFREVERTRRELIITDRGKPVLRIAPYQAVPEESLRQLRHSVVRYNDPLEPVGLEDWETV